ncbi:Retrovirus-related Pol polyprotein from transposon TNT 1-94 [Vitis vinifera]|uniref:Retrovirus-related Pol polyprotein from transposon TNT 1-94 n=1 Tax=Vitis vinifera TaxID=29760 RepID=A0A438GHK4_VITVI|nr:Retrovirus-related Pol polyprotein from transposon TNT 1-94 [Vitis vinifera]
MASSNTSALSTPVFNGENYQVWAVKMKAYLRGLGLWQWVETERQVQPLGNNPTLNQIRAHEEEEAKAPRALSYIHAAVSEPIFTRIMACETPKEAWDKLKEMYLGSDRTRQMQILNLKRQFEVLRMKDKEFIKEYVDRLMEVVNKIWLLGEDLTDQRVVEKVLVSLPERFESKISSLEDSKDLTKISLAELVHAFQAQEQRRSMRQEESNEEAFLALQKEKLLKAERKSNLVRRKIKRRMRAKEGKVVARRDILHVLTARNKVIQRIFVGEQGQHAQMAENQQQQEQLFIVTSHATSSCTETWLIDSGCTNHMTPELSCFKELDQSYKSKVKIGNGDLVDVKGKGVVAVETPTVDDCKMRDKSFPIKWKETNLHAYTTVVDESVLWHKRFGHFHYAALKHLHQKGLTQGLPVICDEKNVCQVCQFGKQSRLSFPVNKAWRASERLQLIHTDVCGPMKTPSLNGNRYFILFIDDKTRMCWVFFMKQKSEVAGVFQSFKALVENQANCSIKVIRSDNGTEYTSDKFDKFCVEAGIVHQLTVTYSPQQNGVSERKNRTIMEMTRCLLFEKIMPKCFWAEAVNTAVYLLNRLPTKAVKNKTSFEAWYGVKPAVEHLKVFGSLCYTHVPDVKRDKLDYKAEMGIFLGYSSTSKGYRVFNLKTKKIMVSRDIKVDEAAIWNWEKNEIEDVDQIGVTIPQIPEETKNEVGADNLDDVPVRGRRLLDEIYERCDVAFQEPTCYDEAAKENGWRVAMEEELKMIKKNGTWELVDRPKNQKIIGVKWVFRIKYNSDGSANKLKARLVVKGYSQDKDGWKIHHLDVKSAFLNGVLEEDIYVEQPEGFQVSGCEDKVYKLHKALYGLKRAPRAWYSRIDAYLLQQGFKRSESEATLYVLKVQEEVQLIVSLYVDDLLVTGCNSKILKQFMVQMESEFEMSNLGEMKYFLGMEIHQCEAGIFISQQKYALKVLKKFHMERSKSVATPLVVNEKLSKNEVNIKADASIYRSLIGSLLYLSATRPDLMFSASLLSRFMNSPSKIHFGVAKRVLRYIRGTFDYGLWFVKKESKELQGYADSDWAGSLDDSKSTSGYAFSFGSGVFSWNSKKQEVVAQSSAEAEYISAAAAANQAIWLRKLLTDLGQNQADATVIWVDNKSAIAIAKNPVQHGRTKHINVKFHAIREAEKNGEVNLVHCCSENQIADILTKALSKAKFEELRSRLGVSKKILKEEC